MSKASANRLISKCKSWADFTAAVEKLDKKQMGDVFERLTQLYLQTKPLYKTKIKNVWLYSEIPPRVRKKIKSLPTADEGIDLVAETKDGEFWAIQSKYRTDKDKPLTVKELSTFTNLAFNTCKGSFAQAIVVHSVSKPVKKRKLLGNTVEIGLQRWLEMDAGHWTLIRRTIGNKPARPKKRTPRPHQRKAIRSAAKHFIDLKESRGKLIMPCGTGKSLTAFWIANKLDAKTVLLVVPSLALIKQSVEDWTQEMVARGEDNLTEWLCVCSDDSAGSLSKDDFVADIFGSGLPVENDPKEIEAFLKKRTKRQKIIFVTYQSSPVFAKAARRARAKFDLAVMDEAHKTAGEKSKAFATLLFDKNLPIKKRIFMTATERVMRGANDEVVSMDKVDIYGGCFYQLSFKEAIHSDPPIISDYKILTIFVTEDEIRSAIKDRQFVSDRKYKIDAEDSRELAAAIALRDAYKKYRIKHAVSFHRSIQSASDFSDLQETLNASASLRPKVECFHISSKKTAGQRTELLKDFAESKRSLITNARCLTEGVDVPAIDCVLFADPKQSTVDIVQAAGRALRPHADKKFGYIMLPIIVPKGKTVDEFAKTTEFKTVSRLITALSTNDGRIADEFSVIERGKKRRGEIVRFDGNVPVGMKIDFEKFADAISAKVWERAAKANFRPFNEARKYAKGLNLKKKDDWTTFSKSGKLPLDIPLAPALFYKDKGWQGWGHWLGTGNVHPRDQEWRPYREARKFARSLNLETVEDWRTFAKSNKRPKDIPYNSYDFYKDKGWKSYGDWLGTDRAAAGDQEWRPFREAREFARSLGFKRVEQWKEFASSEKRPKDIPFSPYDIYQDKGWKNYGDWLGTGRVKSGEQEWRPFKEARKFARSLNLKSGREWKEFSNSEKLPQDIPKTPGSVYKGQGWSGLVDWLGTGNLSTSDREWRPFREARKFARSLNLKSGREWKDLTKSKDFPTDIPTTPSRVYKGKGWKGLGDWLGTGNVHPRDQEWRPFREARKFARSLGLKTFKDWTNFCKSGLKPLDIPTSPRWVYENKGWTGWSDWLNAVNKSNTGRDFLNYSEAKLVVRSFKLKSTNEWKEYVKKNQLPENIPRGPASYYADKGWSSWGDWLGTDNNNRGKVYKSFEEARKFVRSLKLKSGQEWAELSRRGKIPRDVPKNPARVYKDSGWKGLADWLGNGKKARNESWRSFTRARIFARSLKLEASSKWAQFSKDGKLPKDIPANPDAVYKAKGWISWGDWLGSGNVNNAHKEWRSFKEARKFVRGLNLNSVDDWREFSRSRKRPSDIPAGPNKIYKDQGWVNWADWMGTGNVWKPVFLPFEEARKIVRGLNLKSRREWREFAKSNQFPKGIPATPERSYAGKGWQGMPDWLGTNRSKRKKKKS